MKDQQNQTQLNPKQNNIIRKAAIQSFQPVINKIEEHIQYLLVETKMLKQKNEILERTVMDHRVLQTSMENLRQNMQSLQFKLTDWNFKNQKQSLSLKKEIEQVYVDIGQINSDLKKKDKSLEDLLKKNSDQNSKIQQSSQRFVDIVQQYCNKVTLVEADNKKIFHNLRNLEQTSKLSIERLTEILTLKTDTIDESAKNISLYMSERAEIKNLIEQIWKKMDKAVDIQKYENDWKIIRMENENMKKQNKRMIDEALTDDVRKFLPQMMERMAQIRKVNQLQVFAKNLQSSFLQYKRIQEQKQLQNAEKMNILNSNIDKNYNKLKENIKQVNKRAETIRNQLMEQSNSVLTQISSKMQKGNDSANNAISSLQEETTALILQKQSQIRSDINTLIDRNRNNIYSFVVQLIPQEEKDFYGKMKQFMPLLQKTKKEILERCDQITIFGKGLEERLDSFNNRIIKFKGDVNVDVENVKKKNKIFQSAFEQITLNFKNLGKVISSFNQLFLLSLSMSFDIFDQKQVFVMFHDGIIYQYSDESNLVSYRKMKLSKEQIHKSALASLIKLGDELIGSDQYQFIAIKQCKPSSFFSQMKENIVLNAVTPMGMASKKKQRKLSAKGKDDNKLPLIDYHPSKTIDFSAHVSESITPLNSEFGSARKRQTYKGRYSQMK